MIRKIFLLMFVVLVSMIAQARDRKNIDYGWRFILADSAKMAKPEYNDRR